MQEEGRDLREGGRMEVWTACTPDHGQAAMWSGDPWPNKLYQLVEYPAHCCGISGQKC